MRYVWIMGNELRIWLYFFQLQPITADADQSLLESVLLSDTQLWKAARSAWHRLFIAGLLMDPDAKRDFAQVHKSVSND